MIDQEYNDEYSRSNVTTHPLSQVEPYSLDVDVAGAIRLLENSTFPDEALFFGKIPVGAVFDNNIRVDAVKNYFKEGIYWNTKDANQLKHTHNHEYIHKYEFFLKMVWLSRDFQINHGFEFPIGTHWNPRMKTVVTHPGVVRTETARLYVDTIDAYYFATRGYIPSFAKTMQFKPYHEALHNLNEILLVPDHGTLIPHIAFKNFHVEENIIEIDNRLKHRLLSNKFKIRANLTEFIPPIMTSFNDFNSTIINFKINDPDDNCMIRAILAIGYPEQYITTSEFEVFNPDGEGTLAL